MLVLERKRPRGCKVPKEAVERLEKAFAEKQLRMHGYMLLQGKCVIGEKYWEPYGKDTLHRMYSITKSFVSLAIGLLVREGRIRLEDKICDYFQEQLPPEGVHPWCGEQTIEHLLTMRTCFATTTYKVYDSDDWTGSFFRVTPDHAPGTVFNYDTSASHVLAALVEKLTGKSLLDYLREKVLDDLGFSKEAYIMTDPVGVSQGGSGLMSTLEDVAKVAYLCNHGGIWKGKEYLPSDYLKKATSRLVPTSLQSTMDEQCGYGYFMWMPRKEGFVFYGMRGQLALCFPKQDIIFMTMADLTGKSTGMQLLYDCFYQEIYPYLQEAEEAGTAPVAEIKVHTGVEHYNFYKNPQGFERLCIEWEKRQMEFQKKGRIYTFTWGEGNWEQQIFPGTEYRAECMGHWDSGHFIWGGFLIDEEMGHMGMDMAWNGERITIRMESTTEPCFQGFQGFVAAGRVEDAIHE